MPPYTKWGRTRSGCYFCFYQQKIEWVKLKETHPDLYEKAKEYEVPFEKTGNFFTWSQGESLAELEMPERMAQIKRDHALRVERMAQRKDNSTLIAVFSELDSTESPEDDDDQGCLVCSL
ncbi:putative phage-related protein [Pseudomonas syringae pv. antirrhini]|uniref:Putative phage-related protein n=2 Tax=Pseudomonas TaxID=286 RepID=A0A0N8QMH6_9PSED|nr:putative phage-related protein [Pseudomonas syringae pv. antirrhini]RMP34633.1 putative phage-related protein [Pseudomonas syringae pv. antirrhini]RMP41883.1 putative phage-related protein [Pseudomonas syringae pv. antirrhini]RMW30368.1 putative phage-related protein [Pseudomonas syringae pv. antirrhini]